MFMLEIRMEIYTASQARENLYNLIDHVAEIHDFACITGKRNNAILLSEKDFNAMQETLYLLSVPGMRESIQKGRKESVKKCSDKLDW
jgi:antitoxin YefM